MKIQIDPHTLERAAERGAIADEINEVLTTGTFSLAKNGRKSKCNLFDFRKEWNGRYYQQKKIEVIFVEEDGIIITVTVYVYYGNWNEI